MIARLPAFVRNRRSLYLLALLIIAAQALTMYQLAAGGSYWQDDFLFFAMLKSDFQSLLTLPYLMEPMFGHLSPGLRLMFWAGSTYFHTDYASTLWLIVALYAIVLLLTYRLLRLFFGDTWVSLLLLFVLGFSAMWTPLIMWWTAGAHLLPTMIFTLLAIDGFFRYSFRKQWWWLVLSVVAFALGLLWHEKAMMVIVLLPLMAGLVLARTSSPLSVIWAAVSRTWLWIYYMIPAGIYTYYYFFQGRYESRPAPTARGLVELVALAWTRSFIPGFFGGPIHWLWGTPLGWADPPIWNVVAGQAVVVVLVAASFYLRGWRAWRAWALAIASVSLYAFLAGAVRVSLFGPGLAADYRYVIDAAPYMALALGLAFLPLAATGEEPESADRAPSRLLRLWPGIRRWRPVAAIGAAAVLFAGFLVSTLQVSDHWNGGVAARYVHNLERGLRSVAPGPDGKRVFFDTMLPGEVEAESYVPYNKASFVFPLFSSGLDFNRPGATIYMVLPDGEVRPGRLGDGARATRLAWTAIPPRPKGDPPQCANAGSAHLSASFPLDHQLARGQWFMALTYTRARNVVLAVAMNTGSGDDIDATGHYERAHLADGSGTYLVDFRVEPVKSVRLDLSPNSTICISTLEVGRPVPST